MKSGIEKSDNVITGAKPRRTNDYVRFFDGMFSSAVFITVFALFCSARVGYFLLIALLVTPGVSILWAFISSKVITVSMDENASEMLLSKKDRDQVVCYVGNRLGLPSSLIRIKPECSPNLTKEKEVLLASVMGRRKKEISIPVNAKNAGGARVTIGEVYAEDFFGVVRFPVKASQDLSEKKYGIAPEIPEISSKEPILEEAMKVAYGEDNSEDSIELPGYSFSGFPGYDYREYVPGDPLKRINSKLSAKKDSLMVRLDEKPVVAGVVFLLDSSGPENALENPLIPEAVENLIETSLGMARTLLSRDFGITFFWKRSGLWEMTKIREERELEKLAEELAFFELDKKEDKSDRVPEELYGSGCSIICFTCKADTELTNALSDNGGASSEGVRIYNALTGEGRGL